MNCIKCNRDSIQTSVTVNYIDMFFRINCENCDAERCICGNCSNVDNYEKYKLCLVCKREKSIDEII